MDLLSERGGVRLEEGVHVFPAVEVADAADLGLHDGLGGVAGAVTEDEALNVSSTDLTAVVDNITGRADHDLGGVQAGEVKLGVSEGDPDLVGAGSLTNATHFVGVGGKRVLAVLLQKRQAFLVGDLPHPVRVSGDP